MKLFSKILVPTDFSSHSTAAVRYAAALAQTFDASVCLVHVYDLLPYALPEGMPAVDAVQVTQLHDAFQKQLDGARRSASDAGAKNTETLLLQGSASAEIVRVAEEQGFDLIVMGTHGRTGLAHMLLGSVAEKVIRRAPCPVLTVPLKEPYRVSAS